MNKVQIPPVAVRSSREYWYAVLNMFPFVFLPVVAFVGVLCSLIMPYFTGVHGK